MLAYGTGPMPGGTMVVNADASSSRSGTLGPAGTFVTAGVEAGPQGGSDYQAAVQAASQGADGSVNQLCMVTCQSCHCNHARDACSIIANPFLQLHLDTTRQHHCHIQSCVLAMHSPAVKLMVSLFQASAHSNNTLCQANVCLSSVL